MHGFIPVLLLYMLYLVVPHVTTSIYMYILLANVINR